MRVKRGTSHVKRRKKLLLKTKGYRWKRKTSIKLARPAMLHAGVHAYRGRKQKKREFRALWNIQINAAARMEGTTYSKLIGQLSKKKIQLDRKILSLIAREHPAVFRKIVQTATQ